VREVTAGVFGPGADSGLVADRPAVADISELILDLQSRGLRLETQVERRTGGAGPTDSGMLWVEGFPVTAPTDNALAADSPYVLRGEDAGYGIYRDDVRLASAMAERRPRFYDLKTADGIPYEQIALLHLDSLASTVVQHCTYWGNDDQCTFCGIGLSLESGRTIARKTPEQLAEVAVAARDLDGAVDATLTTGSTRGVDRGALYVARCGQAVKQASGLPVEVQFEPPYDLDVISQVGEMGVDSVGIHIETFDPAVLARVAPGKARTGIDGYFAAWQRAVEVFGEGQVSTYVILGMGEDPELTVEGCKRAVDVGVYPFVVPLRPVAGSLMADWKPPTRAYAQPIYSKVLAYMAQHDMGSTTTKAGCARCQACSGLASMEPLLQIRPRPGL
jgi:radical SAM protein (TIGR04043 family)